MLAPNRSAVSIIVTVCVFAIITVMPLSSPFLNQSAYVVAQSTKQNGLSYAEYAFEAYRPVAVGLMLSEGSAVGADWVTFVVTRYQYALDSTVIYPTVKTARDEDLHLAIQRAHELGLKVTLKPHVDIESSPIWRGNIGQGFDETKWASWFATYQAFLNHYADLANDAGADQLVIGTELRDTSHRETQWRAVIAETRQRFDGPLTYSANHSDEERSINWWDALDIIGISAYYPLVVTGETTVEALEAAWQPHITALGELASRWNRPILFTEIGYRSSKGANNEPWCSDCGSDLDLQLQANTYEAFYNTVYNQPWFAGMYWWGWSIDVGKSGPCNADYSPFNKPAENVLRDNHGGGVRSISSDCNGNPPTSTPLSEAPTATPPPPATPQSFGFVLVDDFEALNSGLLDGQDHWQALGYVSLVDDPVGASRQEDATNQVLKARGENALAHRDFPYGIVDGTGGLRQAQPTGDESLRGSSTGTLHYRVMRDGPVDASSGGSDESAPTAFSGFEPQFAVQLGAPETFRARNGDEFVSLNGTFAPNRWYCVWMVSDMQNESFELTIQGGGFSQPTQLTANSLSSFAFRNGNVDALRTFYLRTGLDSGSSIYIDDIYIDATGRNLSSPLASCQSPIEVPEQTATATTSPTLTPTPTSTPTIAPTLTPTTAPTLTPTLTPTASTQATAVMATMTPDESEGTPTPEGGVPGATQKAFEIYLPFLE